MSEKKVKIKLSEITKKWQRISVLAIIVFVIVAIAAVLSLSSPGYGNRLTEKLPDLNLNNTEREDNDLCLDCQQDLLTGELVKGSLGYPIAIVIDNHEDARPAFGLREAKLVYEIPVEGGVTRYLAIFDSEQNIDKIGPIRSARPYFVDWSQDLSALFVHCGGSPEALVDIAKENVFDLNQFYKDDYFWRAEDMAAPHNVMTSINQLKEFLTDKDLDEAKFFSWKFKTESETIDYSEEDLNEILEVKYLTKSYQVKWTYDWNNQVYVRALGGQPHFDINGDVITARTVIIQETESEVLDEELRLKIKTTGEGKAVVCSEAICEEVKWKKSNDYSRLRYYDGGKEFEFNSGNIWIEVADQEVEYSF